MGWFISALEVAQKLASLNSQFRVQRDERRKALAAYCDCVSDTLLAISQSISEGKSPDFHVGRLHTYGAQLPDLLSGILPQEKTWEYARMLPYHWPPGRLLEIHQPHDPAFPIDLIAEYAVCAGAFKALADTLRAMPDTALTKER